MVAEVGRHEEKDHAGKVRHAVKPTVFGRDRQGLGACVPDRIAGAKRRCYNVFQL
jgi:hypothetical protein